MALLQGQEDHFLILQRQFHQLASGRPTSNAKKRVSMASHNRPKAGCPFQLSSAQLIQSHPISSHLIPSMPLTSFTELQFFILFYFIFIFIIIFKFFLFFLFIFIYISNFIFHPNSRNLTSAYSLGWLFCMGGLCCDSIQVHSTPRLTLRGLIFLADQHRRSVYIGHNYFVECFNQVSCSLQRRRVNVSLVKLGWIDLCLEIYRQ